MTEETAPTAVEKACEGSEFAAWFERARHKVALDWRERDGTPPSESYAATVTLFLCASNEGETTAEEYLREIVPVVAFKDPTCLMLSVELLDAPVAFDIADERFKEIWPEQKRQAFDLLSTMLPGGRPWSIDLNRLRDIYDQARPRPWRDPSGYRVEDRDGKIVLESRHLGDPGNHDASLAAEAVNALEVIMQLIDFERSMGWRPLTAEEVEALDVTLPESPKTIDQIIDEHKERADDLE